MSIAGDMNLSVFVTPTERFMDAMRNPLLGGGLGIASPGIGRLVAPTFAARTQEIKSIKPAEAFMAAVVYQTGVLELLLFYLFIAAIMHQGLHAVRACRRTDMGLLAAAILGFQVASCLQRAYDPLHFPPSRVVFWVWAGVLPEPAPPRRGGSCAAARGWAATRSATNAAPREAAASRAGAPLAYMTVRLESPDHVRISI